MSLPQRKVIRIPDYDYSTNGAYFITICTHNRVKLFGNIGSNTLSKQLIISCFEETIAAFPNVSCPKYVVMPNHLHAIIMIDQLGKNESVSLERIIQRFKSESTVSYIQNVKTGKLPPFHEKIWQRSFYDHIIRNEQDYLEIWQYIDNNPLKWQLDELFEP